MTIKRYLKKLGALTVASVLGAALVVPVTSAPASAQPPTNFTWSTPGTYTWTVPDGVHSIAVTVAGGQGGNDPIHNGFEIVGHSGGRGATITGTYDVSPGTSCSSTSPPAAAPGKPVVAVIPVPLEAVATAPGAPGAAAASPAKAVAGVAAPQRSSSTELCARLPAVGAALVVRRGAAATPAATPVRAAPSRETTAPATAATPAFPG